MSNVKIQGGASGTGTFTISAPNTNTNRTLTLPDTTGTLLDTNSSLSSSKLTGALPAIDGSALTGISSPAGTCAFSARYNSSSWIVVNDGVILQFNDDTTADSFDTDGCYSTSTYKFTAPATGVYMFWYAIYTAHTQTSSGFSFLKNSAKVNFQDSGSRFLTKHNSATDNIQTVTIVIPLNINDTMAVCGSDASTSDVYTGHTQWGGCRLK